MHLVEGESPVQRTVQELIEAVVQTKQRNPTWGCPRVAQQIALASNIPIDKDIVRGILASHYRPGSGGPSWLTFIGHLKDSLWSLDPAQFPDHCRSRNFHQRMLGWCFPSGIPD